MLWRKGEVYQTVMRILHPKASSQGHGYPSKSACPPSNMHTCASISLTNGRSNGSLRISGQSIGSPRTRIPSNHQQHNNQYYYRCRNYQSQKYCSCQRSFSADSSAQSCISRHQHRQHTKSFSAKRSAHASAYDPELAAYMDRWIKVVFSGQRRMQSSIAKPVHVSTTPSFADVDMSCSLSNCSLSDESITSPQRANQQEHTYLLKEQGPKTRLSAKDSTLLLANFRKSMDSIPHSEHSLPPAFRPLGGVYGKKKSMLSRIIRESINTLWDDYLKLSSILREQATLSEDSNDITRFSRLDYTKLMRILCHSFNSTDAARRIVAVHHDMQKHGIGMTRKIYEMTVQANIILGSIPESTRLYHEATTRCGVTKIEPGTREHKKLLRTMIDAFAVNRYASEGIAFLDQLPCFHPESEDPALYTHNLYSSLYLYQFRTEAKAIIQGSLTILTQESRPSLPQHLKAIRHFSGFQFLPQPIHILKTLAKLESNYNVNTDLNGANDSILAFSKTVSGMIIKCSNGCSESISPILQSLLLSDHIEEATRVLDLMLQHGFTPDIDRVRFKLLESLDTYPEKEDLMSIVEQWDAAIEKRSIAPYSKLLPNRSIAQEAPHSNNWAKEYSKFVEKCIHQNNLSGAAGVASYMSKRGWIAQGLDFQKLNSFMVNYGMSSDYITYLDVRYTLGGLLTPDIRTYRRLVYAACRRSDLITAVSLLERVRIRHPDWDLDTSVYNSIISTAAATGRIDIAEKIFTCLLENDKEPDLVTFHGLLNGYSNAKDLSAAIKIPERMVKHKLRPTTKTFNLVMKAYLGSRMDITTSSKLFNAMQLSGVGGVPPDLVTFNQLLEGYRRVGNTMWFDAYFDKYFGTESETADVPSTKGSPAPDENEELKKKKKKRKAPLIRPEKPDDSTLLIQLKHSLNLPGIDLLTVQELWRAVEPKLCPPSRSTAPEKIDDDAQIKSAKPPAKVIDPDDTLPSTNVPFKRWLGSVSMPATNREHFRFSTLNLFRTAFQSRGDLAGVKKIDGIFADLFPNHPMGQAVHYRRLVKNNRFLAKLKSLGLNQGKGQSQDENKDEDVDENVYVEEKEE